MSIRSTPDPIDVLVGTNIRLNRLEKGITQSALAEALDLSFQQIQKYEKGVNRVSASMLVHISKALDLPVTALLPPASEPAQPVESMLLRFAGLSEGPEMIKAFLDMSPDHRDAVLVLSKALARSNGDR